MNKPRRPPRRRVDGVLLLDKPAGITSNAALQKARWLFNAEKAGHTGTLDPLATGLLPLCFGEATKFSAELLDADKTYLATVRLGVITDTADAEGTMLEIRPVSVSETDVQALLLCFTGSISQVPPMYSALKRDGTPLYQLARQGITVEREARQVTIHGLELRDWRGDIFDLWVHCSKGTYVRTLAADLGNALGCGAHLTGLRRLRVGALEIAAATPLAALEGEDLLAARDAKLLPVDTLVSGWPRIDLEDHEAARILQGQPIRWLGSGVVPSRQHRLYGPDGFIGVGECAEDGWLKPKRLIATPFACV